MRNCDDKYDDWSLNYGPVVPTGPDCPRRSLNPSIRRITAFARPVVGRAMKNEAMHRFTD